jgi:DNA-binding transcriptional LysR family regulator
MTLQQLQYFVAACEHGSFSAAAEELHMAQPSLSEQIRRLEAELGVRLFRRASRGLIVTDAGATLREHAERVLADVEAARDSVAAVRELRGGTAAFGTFGTSRYYPGTEIVAAFRRRHPAVRVRFVGANSSETAEAVREGELEAGMVSLPVDDRGLDLRPIMRDEIFYASCARDRLARPMTIEALAHAPLILPDASFGNEDPTRRQLNERAQRAGVRIEPIIDVEDVEASVELARDGLGDTILARGMIFGLGPAALGKLGWVPFKDPLYDTFAFITRRGVPLSPATREFLALAEQRFAEHARVLGARGDRRRDPGG